MICNNFRQAVGIGENDFQKELPPDRKVRSLKEFAKS